MLKLELVEFKVKDFYKVRDDPNPASIFFRRGSVFFDPQTFSITIDKYIFLKYQDRCAPGCKPVFIICHK